jgi:cytochrome c-type biogenesis protein CcmH
MRRALAVLALAGVLALVPATVAAACPRASLPDIEQDVMCLVCGVPLALADAPQAARERDFITHLIDRCQSTRQIKAALVAQYGPRVLALPEDDGFGVAAYLAPLLALLIGGAVAVLAVRAWARGRGSAHPAAAPLSGADARRLDAELGNWDR